MKCYHCNENDAESRFIINFFGQTGEILLCQTCLEELRRYAGIVFEEFRRDWNRDDNYDHHQHEQSDHKDIPEEAPVEAVEWDAGAALRRRRRLNELTRQLANAVAREDYELAATLRDEIAEKEEEVCFHGA